MLLYQRLFFSFQHTICWYIFLSPHGNINSILWMWTNLFFQIWVIFHFDIFTIMNRLKFVAIKPFQIIYYLNGFGKYSERSGLIGKWEHCLVETITMFYSKYCGNFRKNYVFFISYSIKFKIRNNLLKLKYFRSFTPVTWN